MLVAQAEAAVFDREEVRRLRDAEGPVGAI